MSDSRSWIIMVVKKINFWQLKRTQPNPFHRRKFRTQPNPTQPMDEPNPWPCLLPTCVSRSNLVSRKRRKAHIHDFAVMYGRMSHSRQSVSNTTFLTMQHVSELHAGPNFATRPNPEKAWPVPTRPAKIHEFLDPSRPDPLKFTSSWTRPDPTR